MTGVEYGLKGEAGDAAVVLDIREDRVADVVLSSVDLGFGFLVGRASVARRVIRLAFAGTASSTLSSATKRD